MRRTSWNFCLAAVALAGTLVTVLLGDGASGKRAEAATAAGPTVARVSGGVQHGKPLVITGAGFGSHGDFHSAPEKIIKLFDDFNDGELANNAYRRWDLYHPEALGISRDHPRTALAGDRQYRRKSNDLGALETQAGNYREYYASFWMRLSDRFDITSKPSGSHQFKIIRVYSRNSKANVYPAIGHSDGFHLVPEYLKPLVMRYQLQLERIPDRPHGWHKMSIYFKKSSAPDAKDGRWLVWWDNKLVFDWRQHFQNPKNNPSYAPNKISGDFDTDNADLAGVWAFGHYFSSASAATWADFDDVYMSHTLARAEICNAGSYAAATRCETQEPTAWGDTRIGVKSNLGALNRSGPLWLYVFDRAGRVSGGFPLSAGAGLRAAYFDNVDLSAHRLTRTDPAVNFNWVSGSPSPAIGADTFSARWTGEIEAPSTGTYTFYARTDDGVRLWVDDKLVIDRWADRPASESSGTIALNGGRRSKIRMEYYENGEAAVAELRWSGPGFAKQIVPKERLYPAPVNPSE